MTEADTRLSERAAEARRNVEARTTEPRSAGGRAVRPPDARPLSKGRLGALRVALTLLGVVLAVIAGWWIWNLYMAAPWTRDGAVRVYVVNVAPEVSGRIVQLPVADNQFVRKGDVLIQIDPADYQFAVATAEANVRRTQAAAENAQRESERRQRLSDLAASEEIKQTYASNAVIAQADYHNAQVALQQAQLNLERTHVRSPVNGWVTNLLTQQGDYATAGRNAISVVDADSFWVDGYFEEVHLGAIRESDPAEVKLMGYSHILHGHVDSVARGIATANVQTDPTGLAAVNPIFTWVRLAQRVPVRIHIDQVPEDVRLVAGMTATVEINPQGQSRK